MIQRVSANYPELMHYTTAAGLQGIIETQQLWATNIAFLNDAEERTGFFDRRLPHLLDDIRRDFRDDLDLPKRIRKTALQSNEPFIFSFCRALTRDVQDHGLLSQWRGYGVDGAYAIVFETKGLEELLDYEHQTFNYEFFYWGDVEYYNADSNEKPSNEETTQWEQTLRDLIRQFLITRNWNYLERTFEPVTALSCLHKHTGFSEEAEFRIIVVPPNARVFATSQDGLADKRPKKSVHFRETNGISVPYVKLFGKEADGATANKLPIARVIVGPHSDKLKRKKAVSLLLEEHGIDAAVLVSDIPYLGR